MVWAHLIPHKQPRDTVHHSLDKGWSYARPGHLEQTQHLSPSPFPTHSSSAEAARLGIWAAGAGS